MITPCYSKSTFFNVLTKSAAPAENFPFCTIDPNESEKGGQGKGGSRSIGFVFTGRVAVPDERFDYLCQQWKPASIVPAYLHVVDIAGLVKGAHEGKVWGRG